MGIVGQGSAAAIAQDWHAALAALAWQVDLGATEACGEAPVNRYEAAVVAVEQAAPAVSAGAVGQDPAPQAAEAAAAGARDLAALRAALATFAHCDLRRGARNLVFAEGQPGARVMVLAPPPGREEDVEGRVFAGPRAQLFARMLAAIGLSTEAAELRLAVYAAAVIPWRPPSDRAPEPAEIAMLRPFVARHVALARPEVIVAMGAAACEMLLGATALGRVRGRWGEALGCAVLPMSDPAHLLRNPGAKREAWTDLLALQARLRGVAGMKSGGA